MKQGYLTIPASAGTASSQKADIRLTGAVLTLTRITWIVLVLLAIALFAAAVPFYFRQLDSICTAVHCGQGPLTRHDMVLLQSLGFSLSSYATSLVAIKTTFALIWFAIGIMIFLRKSDDWIAVFVSFFLITFAITFNGDMMMALPSAYWLLGQIVRFLGSVCFGLFFNLFPDGRFVPRWMLWFALPSIAWQVGRTFFPGTPYNSDTWPILLGLITWIGSGSLLIYAQIYRYRHVSNAVQQQQTKWVVFGLLVALLGFLAFLPIFAALNAAGPLINIIGNLTIYLCMLLIPLSLGFAILRYRLWDIDIIINRTLVYGTLTLGVFGCYVLIVGGLGTLLEARGNFLLSLLATGLIAVLFQPVHMQLQKAVNRLMYGERDEPYQVISRLGSRLEATLAPEAVLPTIVETVAQALKLPYVAITLKQDGEYVIAASYGQIAAELVGLPLVYQNEQIGELLLVPRATGKSFTPTDQALLNDLARQADMAVHAVRLTTDLQRLTKELQHSRTQLVTAREEERRRLRRDLHDGLGSVLASLNWGTGTIRSLLSRDPATAEPLVVQQQQTIQAAIADIRRLVYDLRPPALDELGLVGAIRESALKQSTPGEGNGTQGLHVDVVAPDALPALPAAIEVAAYRIVQEALTNVIHHAHANKCSIHLEYSEESLRIEITDDGTGLPAGYHVGVGLVSMRERAEELGGTCEISSAPGGGTRVQACFPLAGE